jgi:hypothetical protein
MNIICTACYFILSFERWPDDGQVTETYSHQGKNKITYRCVDWNQNTVLLSLYKNQFPETGNKGASIAYSV